MNWTSLKHVSWYLIGINCSSKSCYPTQPTYFSPKAKVANGSQNRKRDFKAYIYISSKSHHLHQTKKVGTKKKKNIEREGVPLIFGVVICFWARDWSCWSSSWRASLALSGSTSNCCESFSAAWTTQDRKEDGLIWDIVSTLVLLDKDVAGSDSGGLLRNERLRRECIWMWEMKPQPLTTI